MNTARHFASGQALRLAFACLATLGLLAGCATAPPKGNGEAAPMNSGGSPATDTVTAASPPQPADGGSLAALPPSALPEAADPEGAGTPEREQVRASFTGTASWYGRRFHGRLTASGSRFDMNALTAAHPDLPFGTRLRVTHLDSKRSVIVTVNDRGPFIKGRVIDLSRAAAGKLGFISSGLAQVRVEVLAKAL